MFYVYILESLKDGRFYVGQTDNLIERFQQHQHGSSRSTKGHRPWWMPYYETHPTRREAIRRERELKRKKSAASLRRVVQSGYTQAGLKAPARW